MSCFGSLNHYHQLVIAGSIIICNLTINPILDMHGDHLQTVNSEMFAMFLLLQKSDGISIELGV